MTIGRRIVAAIAAFANLHPVAREVLTDWFDEDEPSHCEDGTS